MAITTYSALLSKLSSPRQTLHVPKVGGGSAYTSIPFNSLWKSYPNPGTTPTTAAACDNSMVGSIGGGYYGLWDSGTTGRIGQISVTSNDPAVYVIADRLSHQGGLSGTTTGAQTTNLPTATLTRYTDGVGVWAALEIYTGVGTTARTVTASYTNSASASGHTTEVTQFGGSNYNSAGRFVPLPMQSGDFGVKSVESVTLSASTGSAGNFGVTLFKPLFMFQSLAGSPEPTVITALCGGAIPKYVNGAHLFLLSTSDSYRYDMGMALSMIDDD